MTPGYPHVVVAMHRSTCSTQQTLKEDLVPTSDHTHLRIGNHMYMYTHTLLYVQCNKMMGMQSTEFSYLASHQQCNWASTAHTNNDCTNSDWQPQQPI